MDINNHSPTKMIFHSITCMIFVNYAQIIYITNAMLFISFTQASDHISKTTEQFETLLNQLGHSFNLIGLTELSNSNKNNVSFQTVKLNDYHSSEHWNIPK